ncbi:hypothetical protein [Salipiger abyssi]|uniref:hypothetical protein n=1 Tax=Salipiger abyssi TaxID=1250539 RepID=UPI001A8F157A|nr:hypothetical protein [Salipiger abyssi]MBN9887559.1 hypothetical protein [Salipiger abyssi]
MERLGTGEGQLALICAFSRSLSRLFIADREHARHAAQGLRVLRHFLPIPPIWSRCMLFIRLCGKGATPARAIRE